MKSRRRVALRGTPQEPSALLADRRRDFIKDILQRIQDLPQDDKPPRDIQDDIKKYARTQNSEKAIVRLTDYPVSAIQSVLTALLQDLDGNLSLVVNKMLKEIRLADLQYMTFDTQLKMKLAQYVQENLSAYLPDTIDGPRTDVTLEKLQQDLAGFFPQDDGEVVGNVFEPLFHSFLDEEKIKTFLATCEFVKPDGQVSIRPFVSRFINDHRFDPIQKLFESGFRPTSPNDWKDALPPKYYESFPATLWRLKEWDQFKPFVELTRRYSLDIHDFIRYSFYKDNERLIRLGHEIRGETPEKIKPSKHAPYHVFYNQDEAQLLQRTRPWVDGLVSVLIKPKNNCDLYIGRPYEGFYFPTDMFYKDLANPEIVCKQEKSSRVFSIKTLGISKDAEMYIYHLMMDGQIIAQNYSIYEKGVAYMSVEKPRVRIPKIEEFFLSLSYENMSPVDQKIIHEKIHNDLVCFLPTVFDDKLEFDAMSSTIVSSLLDKHQHKPLRDYLKYAFNIYFLFSPRYNLDLLTNVIKDRMNLFFYQLENLDELPVDFYYPQYHFLEKEKQNVFDRWRERCMNNFITETLYYLFIRNYPVLQVQSPETHISSSIPKAILLGVEVGDKISLLHPYQDQYIFLPDVAESIIQNQEYLVNKKPIHPDLLSFMEKFFDLERVRAGLGSYMMDNDYDVPLTMPIQDEKGYFDEDTSSILPETLPDFKEKAYEFLALL